MKCPICQRRGLVTETAQKPDGTTRRRYACTQDHRWSTSEAVTRVDQQKLPVGRIRAAA